MITPKHPSPPHSASAGRRTVSRSSTRPRPLPAYAAAIVPGAPTILYPATPDASIAARDASEQAALDAAAALAAAVPPAPGGIDAAIGKDQFEFQGDGATAVAVPPTTMKKGRRQQNDIVQQQQQQQQYRALLPDRSKTAQQPSRPPSAAASVPTVVVDAYGAEVKRYATPLQRQRDALRRALVRFHRAEEREAKARAAMHRPAPPAPVQPSPPLYVPIASSSRPLTSASRSRPSSSNFSTRPATAASGTRTPFAAPSPAALEHEHSVPFWLPLTKREGSALFDEVLDAGPPALSAPKLAVGGLHASPERQAVSLRIHHEVERQAAQTHIPEDALIAARERARTVEEAQRAREASRRDINPYSYDPSEFAPPPRNAAHPSAYIPYLPPKLAAQELAATMPRGRTDAGSATPEVAYFYAADGSLQQTTLPPVVMPRAPPSVSQEYAAAPPPPLRDPALPNLLGWVMSLHPERMALRQAAERWRGNAARNDAAARREKQHHQRQQHGEESKEQPHDSPSLSHQALSARHSSAPSPLYITPRPPSTSAPNAALDARELHEQRELMNAANGIVSAAAAGLPPRHSRHASAVPKPPAHGSTAAAAEDAAGSAPSISMPPPSSAPLILSSTRSTPPPLSPDAYPPHIPPWKASILAAEARQAERLRAESEWRRQQGQEPDDAVLIELMRHAAIAAQPGLTARLSTPAATASSSAAAAAAAVAPTSPSKSSSCTAVAVASRPSPTAELLAFASRHRTSSSGQFHLPFTSAPDPNSLLSMLPSPEPFIDSLPMPEPFALSALTEADLLRVPKPNFAAMGESPAEASRNRVRELAHEALFDVNDVTSFVVEERRSRRGSKKLTTAQATSSGAGTSNSKPADVAAGPPAQGLPPTHSKSRSAHISSDNAAALVAHSETRPRSAHSSVASKRRSLSNATSRSNVDAAGGGGNRDSLSSSLDLSFLPSAAELVNESALRESLLAYFSNPAECSFVSSLLSNSLEAHTPWLVELLADCRAYALQNTEVMDLLREVNKSIVRPSDVLDSGVAVVQAFRAQLEALGRVPKFPRAPSEIPPVSASAAKQGTEALSSSPWHTSMPVDDSHDADVATKPLEMDASEPTPHLPSSELAFSLRAGPTVPPSVAAAARRPLSAKASASPPGVVVVSYARSLSKSDADQVGGGVAHFDVESERVAAEHPLLAVKRREKEQQEEESAGASQQQQQRLAVALTSAAAAAKEHSAPATTGPAASSAQSPAVSTDASASSGASAAVSADTASSDVAASAVQSSAAPAASPAEPISAVAPAASSSTEVVSAA